MLKSPTTGSLVVTLPSHDHLVTSHAKSWHFGHHQKYGKWLWVWICCWKVYTSVSFHYSISIPWFSFKDLIIHSFVIEHLTKNKLTKKVETKRHSSYTTPSNNITFSWCSVKFLKSTFASFLFDIITIASVSLNSIAIRPLVHLLCISDKTGQLKNRRENKFCSTLWSWLSFIFLCVSLRERSCLK